MFKRVTTSNGPPPPSSTPPPTTTPPPPKNHQSPENSMKSKKTRKTKTGGAVAAASLNSGIKHEKRRKSDQNFKKKPAEDSIRKPRGKSAEKKKKKAAVKEEDSYEESKRKAKKPKRKAKNIELKKILLKEEEEGSERKKNGGGGKDENNSSRRQLLPANVTGPLAGKPSSKRKEPEANGSERHVRQAAAVAPSHPEHLLIPAPPAPTKHNNNSDKQQKGSDQKQAPGEKQLKRSSQLTPNNNSVPPPGTTAAAAAVNEESEEEEEESSANKTPPDRAEPNECGSDLEPDAFVVATTKDKSLELATKGETFTIGALKVNTLEALKGSYGSGMVILKEFDKKIEGYTAGAHLTIKFEKNGIKLRRLFMEIEIIKLAYANKKSCVPSFVESADHGTFHCLVIDGLGPSLGEIYDKLNGFSVTTTIRIALVTLDILQNFHSMLFIHRDIRPHSFYVGKNATSRNKIVLGQMGLARKFGIKKEIEPEEKCDLEMRKPKYKLKIWHPRKKVTFVGAVRYAPRASHLHKEHTRRDDMESWFFMIYEFLNKSLPWKSITEKQKIFELKDSFIMEQKFSEEFSKKFGSEMTNICEYFGVQNFFEMEPDYDYFALSIANLLKENKPSSDKFDWELSPNVFDRTGPSINEEGKKTAATTSTKPT